MAMRLLAVSRRSMGAIRRPNRVLEGSRPMDAVLDMFVPFSRCGTIPLHGPGTIYVYQMPATTGLFCIAAIAGLHCSKINESGIPDSKRPPAAFVSGVQTGLFGRLLPRRLERAGIVDLSYLVV